MDDQQHDQISSRERGKQMLMELAEVNTEELIAAGIDKKLARKIGLKAADRVRKHYGGENVYFAKGVIIDITEKHWKIWDEFNGGNKLILAKKYNLSIRQIEKIIARCREEWDSKHQMDMFG